MHAAPALWRSDSSAAPETVQYAVPVQHVAPTVTVTRTNLNRRGFLEGRAHVKHGRADMNRDGIPNVLLQPQIGTELLCSTEHQLSRGTGPPHQLWCTGRFRKGCASVFFSPVFPSCFRVFRLFSRFSVCFQCFSLFVLFQFFPCFSFFNLFPIFQILSFFLIFLFFSFFLFFFFSAFFLLFFFIFSGITRHAQVQHAQRRVPCHVFVESQSCMQRGMAQVFEIVLTCCDTDQHERGSDLAAFVLPQHIF